MTEIALIPAEAAAVTPQWLTRVLSASAPGTKVREANHLRVVHGAGTKLLLAIEWDSNPHVLPDRLWVKTGWEDHSHLMESAGVYAREASFYAYLADAVGSRAPTGYFSAQDETGRSVVIIEDLRQRDADLWECTTARSPDDVAMLLDTLAKLHARWWESAELLALPAVGLPVDADGPTAVWPRANGGERLRAIVAGPRGALMPVAARDAGRIEKAFWKMVETLGREDGRCLLHGDAHPGNCFTDAEGAGLYDWQTIARGPWAYDVSYIVATGLSIEDRRLHERDLLVRYLSSLSAEGVARIPTNETAWDDMRRYIAYPLLIWPTNHISHQSEENIGALTERLGAACADYHFFDLWRV